jgi:hypothetical protein
VPGIRHFQRGKGFDQLTNVCGLCEQVSAKSNSNFLLCRLTERPNDLAGCKLTIQLWRERAGSGFWDKDEHSRLTLFGSLAANLSCYFGASPWFESVARACSEQP